MCSSARKLGAAVLWFALSFRPSLPIIAALLLDVWPSKCALCLLLHAGSGSKDYKLFSFRHLQSLGFDFVHLYVVFWCVFCGFLLLL